MASDFTFGNKNRIKYNSRDLQGLYQLYCVDDDLEIENQMGVSQSASMVNGAFVDVERDNFTFSLKFIRKVNGIVSTLDTSYCGRPLLDELNRVFFNTSNDGVNTLEIGSKIIYCVATEGSLTRHSKNTGEFEIQFESLSPYCFSPIMYNPIVVNTDNTGKEIELTNQGIDTYIEFSGQCVKAGNITLTNLTNGSSITVECMAGDSFIVDGDSADVSGVGYDKVSGSIIDALGLVYGKNRFKLTTTGEFKTSTKYQMAFGVY